jgi:hypothetical protein
VKPGLELPIDGSVSAPAALVLLRNLLPELPLKPGVVLPGRVLDAQDGRGTLLLAGARVSAALPPGVAAGDALRLRVQESAGERLVLKVVEGAPAPAGSSAPAPAPAGGGAAGVPAPQLDPHAAGLVALPGGGVAQLVVEPDGGGEAGARPDREGPRTVTLRVDTPALGRLDVVLSLAPGQVAATVLARAGAPVAAARQAAGELRGALRGAASRPAQVVVATRGEAVDLRA